MTRVPRSPRTALVTGVAGQDGVHLARQLLAAGHRVVGTVRPGRSSTPITAAYLDEVELVEHDQRDGVGWSRLLEAVQPDEVYNLAGFTSVGASWQHAEEVAETNAIAVLRILESLVAHRERHGEAPRFFQPSSSEMFGMADQQPQTEGTPHHPRSPYATSKSFAHHLTINYRESYGLFTATGTCYNHESPLRGPAFVTRKISRAVAEISLGRRDHVTLGNLDVRRDWGGAADYVTAMMLMLAQDEPGDLIIATGISHPLSELLEVAFAAVGIHDPTPYVRQDPALIRPADVPDLYGDATKAAEELGWTPTASFADVVEHMVRVDLTRLSSGVEEHPTYLSTP